MKVIVDPDTCLGCGICEGDCPEVFRLGDEPYALVLLDPVPEQYWDAVKQSVDDCPEQAISIKE